MLKKEITVSELPKKRLKTLATYDKNRAEGSFISHQLTNLRKRWAGYTDDSEKLSVEQLENILARLGFAPTPDDTGIWEKNGILIKMKLNDAMYLKHGQTMYWEMVYEEHNRPKDMEEFLIDLDKVIWPALTYFEETVWPELNKIRQIKKVKEATLLACVQDILERNGLQYTLESSDKTCDIKIKMENKRYLELSLNKELTLEEIKTLEDRILSLINISDNTFGKAKLRINAYNSENDFKWKGKWHTGLGEDLI